MNIRIIGAVLIILGCGGVGFAIAASYHKEERTLRQLLNALDYMQCELQYHRTPLPELCRQVAAADKGILKKVFFSLTTELEDQISPDVERCMAHVLSSCKELPQLVGEALELLGQSLGRFDIEGQLKGLERVRSECRRGIENLEQNEILRNRSYQTLGLCAGAALAILFV